MEAVVTNGRSGRKCSVLGAVLMFPCICIFIIVVFHLLSTTYLFQPRGTFVNFNSQRTVRRFRGIWGWNHEIAGWEQGVPRDAGRYVQPSNDTAVIQGERICGNRPKLVIIVATKTSKFSQRLLIRRTWASQMPGHIRIGFIVGLTSDPSIQKHLEQESEQFQDIIQENVFDSFNNLTLKSIFILKWFIKNCHNSTLLMKCDDDTFVNIGLLDNKLANYPSKDVLVGKKCSRCWAFRNVKSKWFVPKYMYAGSVYPDFLFGWAYFMSMDVAVKLYAAAMKTPVMPLEDVYLTGLCAEEGGVPRKVFPGYSDFVRRLPEDCPANLIMCHPIRPYAMWHLWEKRKNGSGKATGATAVKAQIQHGA